jgi:hypothetical protein
LKEFITKIISWKKVVLLILLFCVFLFTDFNIVFAANQIVSSSTQISPKQVSADSLQKTIVGENVHNEKAPKVLPNKPIVIQEKIAPATLTELTSQIKANKSSLQTDDRLATPTDTTPPIGPTQIRAESQSIFTINANWDTASDPESGINAYIWGIGTVSSGDYSTLANVHWWQATYDTNVTIGLNLDPNVTYYVSVFSINNQGLSGSIITSPPIHPIYLPLGQTNYVMQIHFANTGIDLNGNPTTGWTQDEIDKMNSFISKLYPILVDLYGPPADNYTVNIVRDLRFSGTNMFVPSTDEIHKDDSFYPQLLTHELIHAFRNDHLLSSDQDWKYDTTLSSFEESFAQAVSYEAMNKYVQLYPNDSLVPGNSLWGSSFDWDYDFQNTDELKGTDFWSEGGGTGLFWLKYEMGATAIRKINLESPGFYKRFNKEFYARINANPTSVRVSRPLIVDIIKTIIPQIESMSADTWINKQNIFYAQNVYGKKIWHNIQDYPWDQFFAFHSMYFMDTMSCGREWTCWDGTKWVYHRLNGSHGSGSVVDVNGVSVWSGDLLIEPTTNPSDGYYGFGRATKNLTTATSLDPWPGGDTNQYILNLTTLGLYKFNSSFTDSLTGIVTSNSIYRVMGSQIANNFKGVWGGVLGHKNGTIYLNHEGFADEPGIPVSNGAFSGLRSWAGVPNSKTGGTDSIPGKIFITFTDSDTSETFYAQRNIDYGSVNGNQMFLFDFTSSVPPDTTAPSVSVTNPLTDSTVYGNITVLATASDNVGVTSVQFKLDGQNLGREILTSPYLVSLDTTTLSDASHTIVAIAKDAAGNSSTSSAVQIIIDNKAPKVSLTAPVNGATITGAVTVFATATSSSGVSRVEFYRDSNILIGTVTSSPYRFSWDTSGLILGSSHTLFAKAYGVNSKTTSSSLITVTIKDTIKPNISITSPLNNANITTSSVTINVNASDNLVIISKVEFYVDGTIIATNTKSPYSTVWNTDSASLGNHSLTAKAYDQVGNVTTSAVISVKVSDTTLPTVSISSPVDKSLINKNSNTVISAVASDNRAIQKVEFYVNNILKCTDTNASYLCVWAVPNSRGILTYTLKAIAYDTSNNKTSVTSTVTAR